MISLDRTVAKLNKLLAPVERIPKRPTVAWLLKQLKRLDKGKLYSGSHGVEEHEFCALEFVNTVRDGVTVRQGPSSWSPYDPRMIGNLSDESKYLPSLLMTLNDEDWWNDDKDRTKHLLPLIAALWNFQKWPLKARNRFKKESRLDCESREELLAVVATTLKLAQACRGKW